MFGANVGLRQSRRWDYARTPHSFGCLTFKTSVLDFLRIAWDFLRCQVEFHSFSTNFQSASIGAIEYDNLVSLAQCLQAGFQGGLERNFTGSGRRAFINAYARHRRLEDLLWGAPSWKTTSGGAGSGCPSATSMHFCSVMLHRLRLKSGELVK